MGVSHATFQLSIANSYGTIARKPSGGGTNSLGRRGLKRCPAGERCPLSLKFGEIAKHVITLEIISRQPIVGTKFIFALSGL